MDYFKIKESYPSEHNLTYAESTREWFLASEDERIYIWSSLSLFRFFQDPDALPSNNLDLIELINYKGEPFDYGLIMPEGRLIDFFSIGIQCFISGRLKKVFDLFSVEACYAEVSVNIDGVVYPEEYYLLAPKDMLSALDEDKSVYTKKPTLEERKLLIKLKCTAWILIKYLMIKSCFI